MTIGLGVLALLGIIMLGWIWTSHAGDLSTPSRIGFSYGVGLVWVSTMSGVVGLVGLPLTSFLGGFFIGLPAVGWWAWHRRNRGSGWWARREEARRTWRDHLSVRGDCWWWGTAAVVGLLWMITMGRAMVKPIQAWDAWETYATKAKIIFLDSAIPRSMFESTIAPNYPLGIPLQEVWMAWVVGSWDDVAVKLLFPGYLLALLCVVYGELRDRWAPRAAMGGTLFVASLPFLVQHGKDGYTDLPLAYYIVAGAVALTRHARFHRGSDLALASLLAVGIVWTREDGVILVVSNGLLLLYHRARTLGLRTRRSWIAWLCYLGPAAVVWGTWAFTKYLLAIPANLTVSPSGTAMYLERGRIVFEAFVTVLFLDGNWLILWALFALALAYGDAATTTTDDSLYLVWPVILYLGIVGVLSISTDLYQFVGSGTVLNRLVLHVAPLAALWVAVTFGRWWEVERSNGDGKRSAIAGGTNV